MQRAVGIDLGTTFSCVAIVDNELQALAIPNAEGELSTPSVALWHERDFLVGQAAFDRIQQATGEERHLLETSLVSGVKRMIGRPPPGGLLSNGHRTTPVEVSAAILAKLARDASARLGFPVRDIVLTVPAHFVDQERHATRTAAEQAGLRVLQVMNEPSAAALAYTRGQQAWAGTVLVFDLGGGTFDTTVLELHAGLARVISTRGIEELGGINFTNALARWLCRRYEQLTRQPFPTDSVTQARLFACAERAKCELSFRPETLVRLDAGAGMVHDLVVTRAQFEEQIDLFLFQLQVAVEQAIAGAGRTPAEIGRVLLCGGSSRIPAVQQMLTALVGRAPESLPDLDLSVALGAAYQAALYIEDPATHLPMLQLESGPGLLVDCVSYPVGIAVRNMRGEPVKLVMLQSGDSLDTWSGSHYVRLLSTAQDFPPIDVYTGDSLQLRAQDYLGDVALSLPPQMPQGARVAVMMRQNRSGLVEVQIEFHGQYFPGTLRRAV